MFDIIRCCELHYNRLRNDEQKLKNDMQIFEEDSLNRKRIANSLLLIEGHIAVLANVMKHLH